MATVELVGVRKAFGRVVALEAVNLVIPNESFTCMVGPSGSGKSTLLNLTAGFEQPTDGQILIDAIDITRQPPAQRDIAMVFQSYALYPHMNVYDNMAFGLRVRGTPKGEIQRRVNEAAQMLQLSDLLQRKPGQLSGGQRQRVALGRAITRHPKVFLLDEPLSNLDAKLRLQMRVELRLLFERVRGTVIYVTHDQAEAMTLADQVVVLHEGRIQQVGSPSEVYDHPANSFVATFFGSPPMNLLPARIATEEGNPQLVIGKMVIPAPYWHLPTQEVTVGFRPEAVQVGTAGQLPVPVRLQVHERLGSQDALYLSLDTTIISAVLPSGAIQTQGHEQLSIAVEWSALHFFDPVSGNRLEPMAK
jgi:sn-glycerol 3-phosphate transport system ATP-binding protein